MGRNDSNVVVVGGGLVGALVALFMAKRGYKIDLYEYREDLRTAKFARGRSINLALSHRGLRALRKMGIEDSIIKCGIPMKGRLIHSLKGKNKSILYDPRTNQCIYSVSRNFLNQRLLDELEKHANIKLHFNHKLINVDVDSGCLTFLQTERQENVEIKADLIVGADGAFSAVRRAVQQTPLFSYTQTYIDHGYLEMCIPAETGRAMVPNHLHIWPRGQFMMIALPNLDGSWTATLFMPFERFEQLDEPDKVLAFFNNTFPDSVDLLSKKQLIETFAKVRPSFLMSVKCSNYHFKENILLIGDAAHAMVPFYGQGMNCGFEDCILLDSILDSSDDDISAALRIFTEKRKDDAHTMCDLAMYNYIEMRDLVNRPSYLIRKAFDDFLFWLLPGVWIPLYNSVTFSDMSYKHCVDNRKWQDKVLSITAALILLLGLWLAYKVY